MVYSAKFILRRVCLSVYLILFIGAIQAQTQTQEWEEACEEEYNECEDIAAEKYQKAIEEAQEAYRNCTGDPAECLQALADAMGKAGKEYDEAEEACTLTFLLCFLTAPWTF